MVRDTLAGPVFFGKLSDICSIFLFRAAIPDSYDVNPFSDPEATNLGIFASPDRTRDSGASSQNRNFAIPNRAAGSVMAATPVVRSGTVSKADQQPPPLPDRGNSFAAAPANRKAAEPPASSSAQNAASSGKETRQRRSSVEDDIDFSARASRKRAESAGLQDSSEGWGGGGVEAMRPSFRNPRLARPVMSGNEESMGSFSDYFYLEAIARGETALDLSSDSVIAGRTVQMKPPVAPVPGVPLATKQYRAQPIALEPVAQPSHPYPPSSGSAAVTTAASTSTPTKTAPHSTPSWKLPFSNVVVPSFSVPSFSVPLGNIPGISNRESPRKESSQLPVPSQQPPPPQPPPKEAEAPMPLPEVRGCLSAR